MTPRQQEAHTLRKEGLTQQAIADIMGITQGRVSTLLHLNRRHKRWARKNRKKVVALASKYYQANREKVNARTQQWQKSPAGREVHNRSQREYMTRKRAERKAQIVRNALAATFDKVAGEGLRLQLARRFQFKNQPVTDEQKSSPPRRTP